MIAAQPENPFASDQLGNCAGGWAAPLRVLWPATAALFALIVAAGAFFLTTAGAALGEEQEMGSINVAVFDFELIDTSLEGEVSGASEAETARLAMIGRQLRRAFAAAPDYRLADIDAVRDEAAGRRLHSCPGCARRLAAEAGADLAVTGTVQKVSNLILNINIYVHDVTAGKVVQVASADIRGNTDDTWRRGMSWLIKNRLKLDRAF